MQLRRKPWLHLHCSKVDIILRQTPSYLDTPDHPLLRRLHPWRPPSLSSPRPHVTFPHIILLPSSLVWDWVFTSRYPQWWWPFGHVVEFRRCRFQRHSDDSHLLSRICDRDSPPYSRYPCNVVGVSRGRISIMVNPTRLHELGLDLTVLGVWNGVL